MSAEPLAASRSLPVVLRDALAGAQLELLLGTVAAVPDLAHVTVTVRDNQVTVPKLATYTPIVGEPCYLLAGGEFTFALGTVSKTVPPSPGGDLHVAGDLYVDHAVFTGGTVTMPALQLNGSGTVTGQITVGGLQVNGGGNITADLVVSGQIVGGGVRTTNNTIQATGTAVGFFGRAPITQPAAAYTADAAVLSTRLWTALRDLGLIQNV
jgi:hypothetical protein